MAELAAAGYTTDGIARRLGISTKTVEKHLYLAYRRLGVTNRASLAARFGPATSPSDGAVPKPATAADRYE